MGERVSSFTTPHKVNDTNKCQDLVKKIQDTRLTNLSSFIMIRLLFLNALLTGGLMAHPTVNPFRQPREDTNCAILTPKHPHCCFMTDKDHERTQGTEPLHTSPFLVNLVTVNKNPLNKFEETRMNGALMWTLTPLRKDPESSENKQIEGGPIKMQLYTKTRVLTNSGSKLRN